MAPGTTTAGDALDVQVELPPSGELRPGSVEVLRFGECAVRATRGRHRLRGVCGPGWERQLRPCGSARVSARYIHRDAGYLGVRGMGEQR